MRKDNCKNCAFFQQEAAGGYTCRRNPPTTFIQDSPLGKTVGSLFPAVTQNIWCGEFKSKNDFVPGGH